MDNIPLVAYDTNGNLLNNVEIVPSTVSASITLDSYKATVPIKITTTGDLATGKSIAEVSINGTSTYTVDIYGEKSVIDSITNIPVTIDVTGLGGSNDTVTRNVTITKPTGVRYISETSAKINLKFGDEKQKTITVSDIHSKNLDNSLSVNFPPGNGEITLQVKGVESVINAITEENISAYVDLAGYSTGNYEVDLYIEGDDPRVTYVPSSKVKIEIVKQQ